MSSGSKKEEVGLDAALSKISKKVYVMLVE
jgi:hypothetical protein